MFDQLFSDNTSVWIVTDDKQPHLLRSSVTEIAWIESSKWVVTALVLLPDHSKLDLLYEPNTVFDIQHIDCGRHDIYLESGVIFRGQNINVIARIIKDPVCYLGGINKHDFIVEKIVFSCDAKFFTTKGVTNAT